jgi:hypothetical protein
VDITLPPCGIERRYSFVIQKFVADFAHKYKMPPLKLDEND